MISYALRSRATPQRICRSCILRSNEHISALGLLHPSIHPRSYSVTASNSSETEAGNENKSKDVEGSKKSRNQLRKSRRLSRAQSLKEKKQKDEKEQVSTPSSEEPIASDPSSYDNTEQKSPKPKSKPSRRASVKGRDAPRGSRPKSSKRSAPLPDDSQGAEKSLAGSKSKDLSESGKTKEPQIRGLTKDGTSWFGRLNHALGISKPKGSEPKATMQVPVVSVHDDMIAKLKLIAREQSRITTKKVLMELLNTNAFTKPGRNLILKKLKQGLVSQRPPNIEDVVEAAKTQAPALEETGLSIKDAMQDPSRLQKKKDSEERGPPKTIQQMVGQNYKHKEIKSIDSTELTLVPHERAQPPVPSLAYGLDRALFNPGVYHLRDPRSRVFNFDPYLASITPVAEFDYNALKPYITSSRDTTLIDLAKELKTKYTGSTSSMGAALAHFHYLLSQWRPPTVDNLSKKFPAEPLSFSAVQRTPSSIFLRWRDGAYAIDADKGFDSPNILAMLGKSMEKLLTMPTESYERYHKSRSHELTEEEKDESESFHYTTMGDFLMRSQLDTYDPRLPGTGMFDLKTRAVVSIRMDAERYEKGMGYEIRGRHGEWYSFEREYFDMIRSAFLKYSLQVRMGRMDGIYVAFHNISRIFGFQYISLPEMDYAIHGTEDTTTGDSEFKLSLELLNRVLDRATAKFPEQSLRIHFETRESKNPFMYIFATPHTEEEIEAIQNTKRAEMLKFEKAVLGLHQGESPEEVENAFKEDASKVEWEALQAEIEEEIEEDEVVDGEEGQVEASEDASDKASYLDPDEAETDRQLDELLRAVNAEEEPISKSAVEEKDEEEEKAATNSEVIDTEDPDIETATIKGYLESEDTKVENLPEKQVAGDGDASMTSEDLTGNSTAEALEDQDVDPAVSSNSVQTVEETKKPMIEDEPYGKATGTETLKESILSQDEAQDKEEVEHDLLAMYLTVRNKVDGEYVQRPENLSKDQNWTVEYALAEIPTATKAKTLYEATKKRRARTLAGSGDKNESKYRQEYFHEMALHVAEGKAFRAGEDKKDAEEGIKVYQERACDAQASEAAAGSKTVER